jgi:sugar/nucleoside kinase (ribokinase family)
MASSPSVAVASLGLFILDTFEWRTAAPDGTLTTTRRAESVIGGGGTYAMLGARIFLPPARVGILVDRGSDWQKKVEEELETYGREMWHYREKPEELTTTALNLYTGEHRGSSLFSLFHPCTLALSIYPPTPAKHCFPNFFLLFPGDLTFSSFLPDFKYLTHRARLEPIDLPPSLRTARYLHFVCSPTRALVIHSQLLPPLNTTPSWRPHLVYEPIPDRCIPEELDSLRQVLPHVEIFSPNHEEAWSFFGVSAAEANERGKGGIEEVAQRFFDEGAASVVLIRSGALGAYAVKKGERRGIWVPAFHSYEDRKSTGKVVDVTGAGNSFLVRLSPAVFRVRKQTDLSSHFFTFLRAGWTYGRSRTAPERSQTRRTTRIRIRTLSSSIPLLLLELTASFLAGFLHHRAIRVAQGQDGRRWGRAMERRVSFRPPSGASGAREVEDARN